jgi:MFS family permease
VSSNIPKLYAIRLLFWTHFFSAVLTPFYTEWGGLTLAQVLLLNSWFMLCSFLLEVPTGTVADRFGRKTSLVLGSAIASCAVLFYTSRPALPVFLLAEAMLACAYTLHSGADEALAYDSLAAAGQEGRAKAVIARMESFKLAGIVLGSVAGGWVAARFGLTGPMRAYAVPGLLSCLLALTLREPRGAQGEKRLSYWRVLEEGGRLFLSHKVLLLLTLEMVLVNALVWGLIWLYQPALLRAGFPLPKLGLVHAASCIGQILLLSRVETLERLAGSKRRFLVLGGAAAGLSLIAAGLGRTPLVLVPAIVLAFTFGLSRAPLFSAYMNRYIPSHTRATVLSMASMLRTLGIVVVNPLVGWGADRDLRLTLVACGAAAVAVSLASRLEERHLLD